LLFGPQNRCSISPNRRRLSLDRIDCHPAQPGHVDFQLGEIIFDALKLPGEIAQPIDLLFKILGLRGFVWVLF